MARAGKAVNEARERILVAAELLFAEKGFGPVTLRQIGARAGIHHSSLYHHVPGGKADLFVEVMERIFARHQVGLSDAISSSPNDVRLQLQAVADWLLTQPPVDLVRMQYVDMPELSSSQVQRLTDVAYTALQVPVIEALGAAVKRGEIARNDFALVSGGLVGMIQSLHAVSEEAAGLPRRTMAHGLIDVFLNGLRPRS
jgi:AcrR family transcriptional regulator